MEFTRSLIAALGLVSSLASAADAIPLSLPEARKRADTQSPLVRAALTRIGEAEAYRVGAGVWMPVNPTLQVDGRASNGQGFGYGGGLSMLFDGFGAPSARVGEADRRVDTARAEADLARLEARVAVTRAYVATALARMEISHAQEGISIAERLLEASRKRLEAGAGSAVDVTSAEAELAQHRAEWQSALAGATLEELELREAAWLDAAGNLELTSAIDTPPALPALDLIQSRAASPDARVIATRLELLGASRERLSREARPKLGVYGMVDQAPQSVPFGILGLTVELPIAQRNQGPKARVEAERRAEEDRGQVLARHFELALAHHHKACEASRTGLDVLVTTGIPVATKRLQLVEEGWRAGRFDVFRVTAAAGDLLRTEASRVALIRDVWRQRLALERLLGEAPDERP